MPRPNPPRKRPRRRPSAARADAELTRQTAQSTRPQQPPSKSSSGGSGGRGGGVAAAAIAPDEMWARRSYAILVGFMAVIESVISLFLLALQPGSKSSSDFVAAALGLNSFTPITLAAAVLLAAPLARRLTGELRPLRFVETISVALVTYLIFSVLGIAAGVLLTSGSPSGSSGSVPTPLPNATATPTGGSPSSAESSATPAASSSVEPTPTPATTPTASVTPGTSGSPGVTPLPAAAGSLGEAKSIKVNVPSAISAGQQFSVVVKVVNAGGGPAQGFSRSVALTSSDGSAVLPAPYSFTAADKGAHTFDVTLNATGSQRITATDSSGSLSAKSSGIVVAGPAAKLSLVPANPVAAETQASVAITVEDKSNRRVTAYEGTVHVSSSDAQAKLPANYTFGTGDCGAAAAPLPDCGQHTLNFTFRSSGQQTISAKDTEDGAISGSVSGVTVTLPIPAVLAASGFIFALSYAGTVFAYPPIYRRLRSRPRPPADPKRGAGGSGGLRGQRRS